MQVNMLTTHVKDSEVREESRHARDEGQDTQTSAR